jgi:hypothetical protein
MRVRFTKDQAGGPHKAGAVTDLSDDQARKAVAAGEAEEVPAAAPGPPAPPSGPLTMRLRFRATTTLGGASHGAATTAVVEATEEAWAAVNRGEAELDPGPGVAGQPFPPEFVTQAEQPLPPTPEELAELRREQRERQRARGVPPAGAAGSSRASAPPASPAPGTATEPGKAPPAAPPPPTLGPGGPAGAGTPPRKGTAKE